MHIQFNALIVGSCSISYGHPWHCVIRLRLLIQVLHSIILIYLVCGCGAHGKLTDFFFKNLKLSIGCMPTLDAFMMSVN